MSLILPNDLSCGYFDCSQFGNLPFSPEREATRYEIEYYLEDGFYTVSDGTTYAIRNDHIKIARPGQRLYTKLPFTTYYLKFTAQGELAGMIEGLREYFPAYHAAEIRQLFREIMQQPDAKAARPLRLYGDLLRLLDLIAADSAMPRMPGSELERAAAARRFIEEHYGEPLRLADIAAAVHLSGSYFHSIFTAVCQKTPHEYLTDVRIEAAKQLLWDPSVPIDTVAERCGFGCQQYLTAVFKEKTGTTPAKYRRGLQQNYLL